MRGRILALTCVLGTVGSLTVASAGELQLLPVQGNVYALVGAPTNVSVQVGRDGVLLVDALPADLAPAAMALIRKLSALPIRYVISTAPDPERTDGDAALQSYAAPMPGNAVTDLVGHGGDLSVLAHENAVTRLNVTTAEGRPALPGAVVTSEYDTPSKDFYMNDDAVIVYHAAAAHTDGDSMVHFRHADVLSTGDLFTPGQFPRIDLQRGGSVQGELAALNHMLEIAVPAAYEEGGTYIIPGRGRICDEADLVEYRDMVRIVSDRVQELLNRHQDLPQVLRAHPAFDYATEYGGERGGPSADEFVTSVYRSLAHPPQALLDSFAADLGYRYGTNVDVTWPHATRQGGSGTERKP